MSLYQVGGQFVNEKTSSVYQVGGIFVNESGVKLAEVHGLQFGHFHLLSAPRTASDGLQFGQTLAVQITLEPTFGQTVNFTQSAVSFYPVKPVASSGLQFSQALVVFSSKQFAVDTVQFSHIVDIEEVIEKSISHGLQFSHSLANFGPELLTQTLQFSHLGGGGLIIPGGLVRSATHGVQFDHTVQKVLCKAIATSHTATDGLQFSGQVSLPIFVIVPDGVVFSAAATANYIHSLEQGLEFGTVLGFNGVWERPVTQTLQFSHAMGLINKIDLCRYSPSVGTNTDPNAPTPPPAVFDVVVKASQVTLFFPTVSPTSTVIIRAPEYGDRHRLQFDRINRETRGGTLEVFSDPDWPKLEVIEASFTGLKETEAQAILDFFTLTLGQEVGFTDWHGRTWQGIVMTPDTQMIRARRGIVDLSFEFEGEVQ